MLVRVETCLLTMGYEGATADGVIQTLIENNVDTVVDVRLNPISRKPGLSKTKLGIGLERADIDYLHLRELGNPRDNRSGFRLGLSESIDRYSQVLATPSARSAMSQISLLLKAGRVALLCFERDHRICHRKLIADCIREQKGGASDVSHIEPMAAY